MNETTNVPPKKQIEKMSDNFFKFNEEKESNLVLTPKKQVINEENRRSSCKIIENSGIVRNLGEGSNGFLTYMANKPYSYQNMIHNHSDSVMNSYKLKNSENLPMNSLLCQVHPSIRFYQQNNEKNIENTHKIEDIMSKEPNFESFWKAKSGVSKEDCEKINEKLTENLMKEIMETNKSNEKRLETGDESRLQAKNIKKTIIINRPERELSSYLGSISKSREIIEEIQKVPSKKEVLEEKKPEKKQEKEKDSERKISKNNKPKIGISEADFIKINAKTQINEKLIHTNFMEKSDQNTVLDEDLMESSNTSNGFKENMNLDGRNKNKNPFLDFLQVEKRDNNNYFNKEKRNVGENKASKNLNEDFISMSMSVNLAGNKMKSRSITNKKI